MKYRLFSYGLPFDGEPQELNAFLASHRILTVKDYQVRDGACLVFVVEYMETADAGPRQPSDGPRVDYRERLGDQQFSVYCQLRDWRKQVAKEEGVAVFNVLTNAQLAEIVEKKVTNLMALGAITGVGKARVNKYGERLLTLCRDLMPEAEGQS